MSDRKSHKDLTALNTEAERAKRKAAIDYARGSVRLEGFVVSDYVEQQNARFVSGEITSNELTKLILAYHGRA